MATTQVERVRMLHEDIEIFEKAAAEELAARATMKNVRAPRAMHALRRCRVVSDVLSRPDPPSHSHTTCERAQRPDQIMSDHTIHALLGQIIARNAQLDSLYSDADGSLREDIDEMTGEGALGAFYERLARVREAHAGVTPMPVAADAEEAMVSAVLEAEPAVSFSGEEGEGRFVDLHSCHDAYVNLRGVKPLVAPGGRGTGRAAKLTAAASSAVDYYSYLTEIALTPERVPIVVARGSGYAR